MSRFANLADKPKSRVTTAPPAENLVAAAGALDAAFSVAPNPPPSRIGRKAIAAYFSPEMSVAMHVCARKHGFSLQALMVEAFDDVLRKYGESPIGD